MAIDSTPLLVVEELADEFDVTAPDDLAAAERAIRLVSALVRRHWTLPTTLDPVIVDIARAAALRVLTGPAPGVTSERLLSYSQTFDLEALERVFTPAELAVLGELPRRAVKHRARSVQLPADPIASLTDYYGPRVTLTPGDVTLNP